jgi:hypothetical protein
VPGRDIFVQAWYQGGVSVIDFTDSANPVEIAYFDRGPMHAEEMVFGGYWSTYWYDGKIYGTETVRGIDVLALVPSEHLTENEIAAATLADQGARINPQQQFRVSWPAEPVVARAYLDQLQRNGQLPAKAASELDEALDHAAASLENGGRDRQVAARLQSLATTLKGEKGDAVTTKRRTELAGTLGEIAARLR